MSDAYGNGYYVMQDMDISKKAFQKTIKLAEEQIFYPEEIVS